MTSDVTDYGNDYLRLLLNTVLMNSNTDDHQWWFQHAHRWPGEQMSLGNNNLDTDDL